MNRIPLRIISVIPLETKVQLNKTSKHYVKYAKINKLVKGENVEEIKKISQLIVHPQKKQAEYKRYLPDGTIEKVVSEDGVRTYYEKKPHSKQYVRRKELNNGIPNMFHWFMNVFDNEGNFVKQIIQGVKGSPFERR